MTKWFVPSDSRVIRPVPWLSMQAREVLDSIVNPEYRVLEFGGGGSTKWFSSKCKEVVTFENNLDWFNSLAKQRMKNVTLVFSDNPSVVQNSEFDIVFIDGEPIEKRAEWINLAMTCTQNGGWIVLDNANREEYKKERDYLYSEALETITIDGNEGGTLHLVTEFFRL